MICNFCPREFLLRFFEFVVVCSEKGCISRRSSSLAAVTSQPSNGVDAAAKARLSPSQAILDLCLASSFIASAMLNLIPAITFVITAFTGLNEVFRFKSLVHFANCSSEKEGSEEGSAKMGTNQGQAEAEAELFQAQCHLYKHSYNFMTSMSLKAALQLNLPDIIHSHGRPMTLPELLLALQIEPAKSGHLYRLMRLLLLKHHVPTLSPYVEAMFHTALVHTSEFLGDWFQGKELTPFHTANNGMGFWDYLSQNQEFSTLFNGAMSSDSSMMNLVIKGCGSVFEGLNSLVDVGGGKGAASRIISESLPNVQCTVLDLPHVVENMSDSSNLKFVGGDMFQSIPSADAVLLKLVLHAFSDEDCVKVLKKCREAIASKGKEGKVIIIDIVINVKDDGHELKEAKLLFDVVMMVYVTGKEREEK
ncbi:trans-resveratrol di-O-methyltransferase-like [Senna tora]|uniref:Trans-resveratrol di-O-methyltransferase-like n=1 Tax=Senna tora TaxID=362788 RepID=A0A834SXI8_9FABA|nr:trans-resveratrol di-O-methyltransferase-like [Senna tora]